MHIDLFSGIGGFALAAQWAGFTTVAFCENDPFCREVLAARFGAVADSEQCGRETQSGKTPGGRWSGKSVGDNRGTVAYPGEQGLAKRKSIVKNDAKKRKAVKRGPILIPDVRDFDGRRFRGATLLTGGFPCQPFSCAGKRRGRADDRWLWPEMRRIISEARPTWILGENVAGIINMELEQVCLDLEAEGYEVQPVIIPACAVNAPHRRNRVWIIAYDTRGKKSGRLSDIGWEKTAEIGKTNSHAPDAARLILNRSGGTRRGRFKPSDDGWGEPWPEVAARLCRMDDGVPRRVDRLKALGNAVVPKVAYEIIKEIAKIENG